MKFIIELEIGLFFPLKSALSKLKTNRNTKTHRRGRSKQQYGLADAAPRSRSGTRSRRRTARARAQPGQQGDVCKPRPVIRPGTGRHTDGRDAMPACPSRHKSRSHTRAARASCSSPISGLTSNQIPTKAIARSRASWLGPARSHGHQGDRARCGRRTPKGVVRSVEAGGWFCPTGAVWRRPARLLLGHGWSRPLTGAAGCRSSSGAATRSRRCRLPHAEGKQAP
jgi:hypothetical protein